MKIHSILFDLDGTLFDTQKLHAQVEAELIRPYGINITAAELTARYAGRPTKAVFQEVLGCDIKLAQQLYEEKWRKLLPLVEAAEPLCDLEELFSELGRRCCNFGIGTASPRTWLLGIIIAHGLTKFFDHSDTIAGDQVANGKPHPETWLKLALSMGPCLSHEAHLVVEDGLAGTEAALAAEMQCALLLPQKHPHAREIKNVRDVLMFV